MKFLSLDEIVKWDAQLRKYKSSSNFIQPPMILPKNTLSVGRYLPSIPSIHDELNYTYSQYSKKYWENVKKRQEEYRSRPSLSFNE